MSKGDAQSVDAFKHHPRLWRNCLYVYPVVSRRAEGLSIGVNLNRDQLCNFGCIYCQVDRTGACTREPVNLSRLKDELLVALEAANSGEIWNEPRFADVPEHLRRINDIAFSGDGEPSASPSFVQAVELAAEVRSKTGSDSLKIVLITNATLLHQPRVMQALAIMDKSNGQVWAKLDAGSEEYFHRVNTPTPTITLHRVLDNILVTARQREIVIQTLLLKIDGKAITQDELDLYCRNIRELVAGGAKIGLIQLHTVARQAPTPSVTALDDEELIAFANHVRENVHPVAVKAYTSK